MGRNPYAESPGPFSGRAQELETLERELLRGRGALAAIMAGRGMGKTRLARELCERLHAVATCETHYWPRTPGEPGDFLSKLGRDFGREFSGTLFVDDVIEAKGLEVVGRSEPGTGFGPHFTTIHPRPGLATLRVHHVLVQFPGD